MASEVVLQQRIRNAQAAAQKAVANGDQLAYNRACAAYGVADKALKVLEAKRNAQAIHELEMKARPENGGAVLAYSDIMAAGIPAQVLKARGWSDIPNRTGMWLPPKPKPLAIVRNDEAG